MDISQALQYFQLWHYGISGDSKRWPTRYWAQCMVQELLDRMLPYVAVEVSESIEDEASAAQEELQWQQRSKTVVFQFVKAVVMDLLQKISVLVYTNVLGHEQGEEDDSQFIVCAIDAMNSEELQRIDCRCGVVFYGFADAEVSVTGKPYENSITEQDEHFRCEPSWSAYCKRLCDEAIDTSFHSFTGYSASADDDNKA